MKLLTVLIFLLTIPVVTIAQRGPIPGRCRVESTDPVTLDCKSDSGAPLGRWILRGKNPKDARGPIMSPLLFHDLRNAIIGQTIVYIEDYRDRTCIIHVSNMPDIVPSVNDRYEGQCLEKPRRKRRR